MIKMAAGKGSRETVSQRLEDYERASDADGKSLGSGPSPPTDLNSFCPRLTSSFTHFGLLKRILLKVPVS